MQVRPMGQKKPSQQGRQSRVLKGMVKDLRSSFLPSPTLQPQPGSHPENHDVKLQFLFGFKYEESLSLKSRKLVK